MPDLPPLRPLTRLKAAYRGARAARAAHGAWGFAQRPAEIDCLCRTRDAGRSPALREDLRTRGGRVLLDHYGELIDLSASGQIAMRKVFQDHLARVEWDQWKFPVRLYPFPTEASDGKRPIAIDANIAFGRPVLVRNSISTHAIAERLDAGESVADLAADYDLTPEDIEQAALYELAA